MTTKQALALAKSYTDVSIAGAGAIKGKNCEIQSIEPIEGGNRITFAWYNGSDVLITDTLDVMDGEDGEKGDKGDTGEKGAKGDTGNGIASIVKTSTVGNVDTYTITMTDGTTATFTVTNGGVNVVANPEGTASDSLTKIEIGSTIYSISGGSGGASSYTELDDKPTMNGYTIIGDMVSADLGLASASDIPDSLDDLSDDVNHRTVTDTEKTTWNGKADVSAIPTKTTDLTNDSGFITNTVNNLVNYYTKSQIYTQAEVDALITAAKNGRFISVATLPTTDIDTKAIYLVPSADPEAGNTKDEYINLTGTSAGWELIGSTAIDLSGYVQKSQTAGLLKNDGTVNTTIEGAVSANTSAITAIKDGQSLDSFGDVETALAGKMPNYGIGTGLYVDSDTNQLRADAVTLAIKDSPKLITSGAVFSGLSPKYGTAEQEETDLDGQDKFPFYDNSASAKRHTTFGNIKAKLKEYFDSLYVAVVAGKGLSTNDYDDTEKAKVAGAFPRSEQAVLGAKNFAKIDASSDEVDGITYTIDENGVVDIDGTTGATPSVFYLNRNLKLPQGKQFTVSAGVENSNYYIRIGNSSDSFVVATRPNESHTFTADNTKNTMRIGVDANTTVSHVKIYPMIRLATDTDPTYAPPAMTNKELTEAVHKLFKRVVYTSTEAIEVAANGYADVNIDSVSGYQILAKNSTLSGSGSSAYGYVSAAGGSNVVRFVNRDSSSHTWNYEIAVWYIANDAFS